MKVELFPFQKAALAKLRMNTATALGNYRSTHTPQIVSYTAPTGAGKTIIMAALIESIYYGDELYPDQPEAIFVWLSDSPQLNEQSKLKIDTKADKIRLDQCVTVSDESFDREVLEDGHIYFINTQKLSKTSNLTRHSDGRQYTIWETLSNTVRDKSDRLYFIIDEAHRGAQKSTDLARATTIMQKFLKGSEADGLPAMPVVIGMTATSTRFNRLAEGIQSTTHYVRTNADEVRASGLLKDRIVITYPETAGNDMAVLQAAADEWKNKWIHWTQYCSEQHYAYVNPILIVQVQNGTARQISTTDLDDCLRIIEERTGERFAEGQVVHAFLQALKKNAQRIIFVGDPNQLPPIGAGRPFVDLVRRLDQNISAFPRVGKGFGHLTVTMRQLSEDGLPRGDTELAKWFTEDAEDLDDSLFIQLQSGSIGKHVSFKPWSTPEELQDKIFESIYEETEMADIDDVEGFDLSIGGHINDGWMNFGSDPKKVESWQILSAYRNDPAIGTATINRFIHKKYKSQQTMTLRTCKVRGTKHVLGIDGIVYGDKVINVRNQKKDGYPHASENSYVANGEVGIVERIWEKPRNKMNTHQVVFASQPTCNYNWNSTASDESTPDLELAYALTVHKAQGSEFDKAILVLAEPGGLLSKELLYTAITRQKDRLVILYNEGAYKLRDYSSMAYSEVARRFTCLFENPNIVEHKKRYYEQALIHRTLKGDLVRSKSEVIIANMLFDAGIKYEYEKELLLGEDGTRIPDFTIEDAERGVCFYWEHCGMLSDAGYNRHWEEKKTIYHRHGITEGDNLIVSKDSLNGGIDSAEIKRLIERYLL